MVKDTAGNDMPALMCSRGRDVPKLGEVYAEREQQNDCAVEKICLDENKMLLAVRAQRQTWQIGAPSQSWW